jgi:cytosine/adenosine deaminase-related metal-dependent hydrolase
MKKFSAQYILTNTGPPLKRAVITTENDGTIKNVKDTDGNMEERHSIKFYNGIIIPGFVNCHCHLELSHMKGTVQKGGGLGGFIEKIRDTRDINSKNITTSALAADFDMCSQGVVLCADICNTSATFGIKNKSRIRYINLLEVFGIDPDKATRRMDEISKVAVIAEGKNLNFCLVPHSAYSVSLPLFRLLRERTQNNKVTSIHFMESAGEKAFLNDHSGPLMVSYEQSGLLPSRLEIVENHADVVLNEITRSGNLILVHNIFADRSTVRSIRERGNLFWCLCPNSNIHIEDKYPPLSMLLEEGCDIVIGTDSLASNDRLNMIDELKTLQAAFPYVSIEELVCWASANGARALGEESLYGTIEPGKKPGLLLLQDVDLLNMKLLPESFVTRLI